MSNIDFHKISYVIKNQFPEFYLEEGPELVTFVEEYYKWFETQGGLELSRNLLNNRDIDKTIEEFLVFFRQKYMKNLPEKLISDQRELQKHILDLYRSKGSESGLRLLFRILYNEDIEIYVPSYDILKLSDGEWIEEQYLEISSTPLYTQFNNVRITGFDSGATAFVDRIEKRVIQSKNIFLLFLTDIYGDFLPNERVFFEGADLSLCPFVLGSPGSLTVTSVATGYDVGDEITATSGSGRGLKAIVSQTETGRGIIRFDIVDGGDGYSIGTPLTVTTGANTSGSGAAGFVSAIEPTFTYDYNDTLILPYVDVPLNSNTFAFDITDTSLFGQANLDTVIQNGLQFETIQLGRIIEITTTNPGINYDANVNVNVFDLIYGNLFIPDGNGNFLGQNANITGTAIIGEIVRELRISNSGFGYRPENVRLDGIGTPVFADINLVGTGFIEGFWKDNKGFLNADKYIQDSFYYQEFSYEIGSSNSLDKYIKVLKAVMHPAGNEVFGRGNVISTNSSTPIILQNIVSQSL